jgi:hypothetical protein
MRGAGDVEEIAEREEHKEERKKKESKEQEMETTINKEKIKILL